MTISVVVADPRIEVEAEAVQRTLAVARRALRAREAMVIAAEADAPTACAMLTAGIAPFAADIGLLVVTDDETRLWSEADVVLLRDIAAMLATTLRLQEDLKRHRAVVDNVPGLIFERRKTDQADARYTFLGNCKAALPVVRDLIERGSIESEWHFVHHQDRAMLRDALSRSIADERDLEVTFRVEDTERQIHWVRSHAAVRREADGAVVWSGLCLDITDAVQPSTVATPGTVDAAEIEAPASAATLDESSPDPQVIVGGSDLPMLNILLADDLDLNRKLICDMLSLDGYHVDSVADGAAAVEAVKAKTYDLVLMDMIMPGMDGMDATRAIRALPAPVCDVPIVALTAHSFREQLDNCLHAGMNATLTKPMSFEALSSAVSLWARGRSRAA